MITISEGKESASVRWKGAFFCLIERTVPLSDGKDPVLDGKDPVLDGKDHVLDGKDPVFYKKDPVLDGKDHMLDGKDPVLDGKDPVSDRKYGILSVGKSPGSIKSSSFFPSLTIGLEDRRVLCNIDE